jgi:hypothetical protein
VRGAYSLPTSNKRAGLSIPRSLSKRHKGKPAEAEREPQ